MRVVVQIPCHNEETSIGDVIAEIPRDIDGIDDVLVLVVDDGSVDRTGAVALAAGADYVARHTRNRGLAAAFLTGLDASLRLGADIVVNTDGDNQYAGADIPRLVAPIVAKRADLVIGDRGAWSLQHFSPQKRLLQGIGSWVVQRLSGTNVPDAPSGFRALSREAALRLNVVTGYSYTLETLIQAGAQRLAVSHVPITARPTTRRSRLARGTVDYVLRSMVTIVRAYAMYQPVRFFLAVSAALILIGAFGAARFIWFYVTGSGSGHVQSLVLSAVLLIIGFQIGLIGIIADLIAANRRLAEESLYRLRRIDADRLARPGEDARDGESAATDPIAIRRITHV